MAFCKFNEVLGNKPACGTISQSHTYDVLPNSKTNMHLFLLSLCISPSLFYSNGVSGDDDEWDYSDRMVDPNKPGVPVRALYDYEGVESDELSFKVGKSLVGSPSGVG